METLDINIFKTLHDQYNRLKSLQKNDKICKETEPAWSANEAKILLDTMISNLNNLMVDIGKDGEVYNRLIGMKGTLMYEEAKFLINIENELQGQELMSKTLDLLKDYFMKSEITFLILRIVNHYSYLLLKLGEFDKPHKMLENADQMYTELKSKIVDPVFYTADEIFLPSNSITPKKDTPEKVDRLMTSNLSMLGFVHSKKGNHEKYAYYNHQVLNRQLLNMECEPTAWAMKAVKLASYFITKHRFREARHHLAAACHMLEENETELKNSEPNEANIQKWEELQLRFADIAKCWVKYGLFLFGVSKSQLLSLFYGEPSQLLENLWLPPYEVYPPNVFSKSYMPMQETHDLAPETIQKSNITTQSCKCPLSEAETNNVDLLLENQNIMKLEDQVFQIPESELKQPTNTSDNIQINEYKEKMEEKNETYKINESAENNESDTKCSLNPETTKESNENENVCTENVKNENKNEYNENQNKCNGIKTINTNEGEENSLSKESVDNENKIIENKQELSEEIIILNELKQHTLHNDAFHIIFTGLEPKDSGSFDENQDNSELAPKVQSSKDTQQNKTVNEDKNLLLFPSLDLSSRETQVTVDLIESAEQARELFLYTHSWLKQSKMYFTLKDNPMEYVNAILDLSELYKYLAFYEEDIESQYSVQKRRADALETLSIVLREVRPQCYMAVSIELLRELAEVQLEMMGLNLRRLYTAQETHMHGPAADFTLHKMEAMADIHSRLEQFCDSLGHRAEFGDGLSELFPSEISGDIMSDIIS